VNDMLAELRTSHTAFYTPQMREYYELLDIFDRGGEASEAVRRRFGKGEARYEGIGVVTRVIDGRTFVVDVLEDSPASEAGLRVGDEVRSVDGGAFEPIESFRGKADALVRLEIQSQDDPASRREVSVKPRLIYPRASFLKSINDSARIVERGGMHIAYVRIRSYASEAYQEELVKLVTGDGRLAKADALVLDIRGGWGGANPEYLELFNQAVPAMRMTGRDGRMHVHDPHWRKPVVLLVDGGTRSGKEILAHGFKRYGIGKVVGACTAGAVVGGMPFVLKDDNLLMVAVTNVEVDGGRLEGRGVEPDVQVEFDVRHCGGRDPQLDRAVEEAAKEAQAKNENVVGTAGASR
jgi:carboxyl-terminal processing protease